ncbi:DNA mismatch repair ATPase msh1, partial [Ascosphaera atra]
MAGFPFYQLDRYLKLLVQDLQKYVAISEEFSNDAESRAKSGGLLFDRRVARIVTPGTLIDENFMDPYENNFLLAVHVDVDKASPSTSVPVINERLDLVSKFTENSDLRQAIINRLKDTHDAPRLAQKFSLGRGDADDLLSLAKTIEASKNIHSILTDHISSFSSGEHEKVGSLQQLVDRFRLDGPLRLSKDILEAIDEEGLSQKHRMEEVLAANAASMAQEVVTNEGDAEDLDALPKKAKKTSTKAKDSLDAWEDEAWIMRRAASRGLEISHENLERLHEERTEMSANLRESTGIPTLSLKWTSRNGYTVHIKGSKVAQSSLEAIGART